MLPRRVKVLIADDRLEQVESTADLLLAGDFDPVPVIPESPLQTAATARSHWYHDPDLRFALVDLKMPNEGGEETEETGFRLIEEFHKRPGSVVVVRSGFTDPRLQERARALGADGFFAKDADPEDFLATLRGLAEAQFVWLRENPPPADWSERFEAEYPADPAGQLGWLEARLRLDRGRVVGLLGLPPAEAAQLLAAAGFTWDAAAARYPDRLDRAIDRLCEYLELFRYDWEKGAEELRGGPSGGTWPPDEALPSLAALPDSLTPDQKLLVLISSRGPEFLPAFVRYFSSLPA